MGKRVIKTLLFHSLPSFSSSLSLNSNPKSSSIISRQNLLSVISRFVSTYSPDNLDGLIDPDDPFSLDNSRVKPVSAEDFAFLHDSSMDSNAVSGSSGGKLDSGKCSNDAALIVNAIHSNGDVFGDKTHKFLRQFRDKLNETLVVEVLSLVQNPELGVKFFVWAGRQIGYSHTGVVYDALLERLGCDNNERIPESFLGEIKDDDKEVLGKLLNFLIQKYCRNGLWNLALEELGRLKDFGYKPTRWSYNALVQVFLKADRLDTAYLVHRDVEFRV